MLLSKLLLLPFAVASSVTVYVHSLPSSDTKSASPLPSPTPIAQIEYDVATSAATLASFTPPTGAYSPGQLLRIGFTDPKSGHWRGVVTSAASFGDKYKKKFVIHVDDKGDVYHVGFSASARGAGEEVEVEIVKRGNGSKPVLNRPIVLNAEGKLETEEPQKTFLQKYWWVVALFVVVQFVSGAGEK